VLVPWLTWSAVAETLLEPGKQYRQLHKLVRAHANTAEFAPFLAILFLAHGARGHGAWVAWAMAAATACRYLIVVGLVAWPSLDKANPVRFVGALGTYVLGIALSAALLLPA
jgi:uncharacterized membrane protein YecN with MAPEG domain